MEWMIEGLKWKLELYFSVFCFERSIRNMIRAAIRPRATTPPTTPPIIAGVLLTVELLLLLWAGTAENVDLEVVLGEGCGRCVDSIPSMLWARVTLNDPETYENILAIDFQSPIKCKYRNILIRIGWNLDSNWDVLIIAEGRWILACVDK